MADILSRIMGAWRGIGDSRENDVSITDLEVGRLWETRFNRSVYRSDFQ